MHSLPDRMEIALPNQVEVSGTWRALEFDLIFRELALRFLQKLMQNQCQHYVIKHTVRSSRSVSCSNFT